MKENILRFGVAIAIAAIATGCSKESEAPAKPEVQTGIVSAKERMADTNYVEKLADSIKEGKSIQKEFFAAKKKYDEAKKNGASAEEITALKAECDRLSRKFMEHRQKAAAIVNEKMREKRN